MDEQEDDKADEMMSDDENPASLCEETSEVHSELAFINHGQAVHSYSEYYLQCFS
jgi:hypothetical protein